jgi:uncharacterized protein YbdZ (MbtH family)
MSSYTNIYPGKNTTIFKPYCYLVIHIPTGKAYYGSRTCRGADPDLFFKDYFTSSKIIRNYLETGSIGDFVFEIRKIFFTKKECLDWESGVLRRLNVEKNNKFLNADSKQNSYKAIQNNMEVISISDPLTRKSIKWPKTKPIPSGWILGNINAKGTPKKSRKWIYNLTTGKAFHVDISLDLPVGFALGRGPLYKSNSEKLKQNNMVWITNGKETIQFSKNEKIPEGWKLGRTFKTKPTGKKQQNIFGSIIS